MVPSPQILQKALTPDGPRPLMSGTVGHVHKRTEFQAVVPFCIAADPLIVQQEINDAVAMCKNSSKVVQLRSEAYKKLEVLLSDPSSDKDKVIKEQNNYQDLLSTTTTKTFRPVKLRANRFPAKRARTPFCFFESLGPPLHPDTQSKASISSAMIHRLWQGKEHLDSGQCAHLKEAWTRTKELLPTPAEWEALKTERPLNSSRDWLTKDYGRRNDATQVKRLLKEGIEEYERTGIVVSDLEFFVKNETAISKLCGNKFRGIFVAHPTFATLCNPAYYQMTKNLSSFYHPNQPNGQHTVRN